MSWLFQVAPVLSAFLALASCASAPESKHVASVAVPARGAEPNEGSEAVSRGASSPSSARIVDRAGMGRAAEILDEAGTVIETLAPEDFSQTLRVPDIANNTSEMISQNVPGTDIVAVSVQPATGRILLAVRGFLYAEVSTDLVFLLQPTQGGARVLASAEPIYFDGPNAGDDDQGPRTHLDVSRVSFDGEGLLQIETSDASGGTCQLVYDGAGVPKSCSWSAGESRRCPEGVIPK
jgi:hypothetical protein